VSTSRPRYSGRPASAGLLSFARGDEDDVAEPADEAIRSAEEGKSEMERPATPEGKASPRAGVEAPVCEREPRKSLP